MNVILNIDSTIVIIMISMDEYYFPCWILMRCDIFLEA